ncbi:electron transport complex subunit RsxC [Marinibactrum halimedae]|uniref:electron transport complex subunit RsxC n=1 Tax=Marinibactrum halimedae TaxID=1444977 RepID=UPI003D66B6A7
MATDEERTLFTIPGGVHPPENKQQSLNSPIVAAPLPGKVILPLSQHIGAPSLPIVRVGDHVLTGQLIAEGDGYVSLPVHASVSGTIVAIEEHPLPHASGLSDLCIIIESDGKDASIPMQERPDYRNQSAKSLLDIIREAGIAGMGGAGFPAAVKLNPRAGCSIEHLIINGTECEPYITADDILMQERAQDIVAGVELLSKILGEPKDVVIGIEDNKPEAIATMRETVKNTPIQVAVFPTKYPSGGEKQLIQILTGKEVPSGELPSSIGVVVQNVATAYACYRAVRYGEPFISRITTVVGEALAEQRNVEVRLGTPLSDLLTFNRVNEKKLSRLIMGGPMMGFALHSAEVPVVKTTNCLIAPTKKEMPPSPPALACIRCGLCAEACPASLLPQQLYWYARSEDHEKLESHHLFDCIECGACSFVCPSNIPLVQYYRSAKGKIKQQEIEKEKADRSRQRFEFRQERIARAEAEKEAKRKARQQAALEAKQKLAEAKAAAEQHSEATQQANSDDAITNALAKTQTKTTDPKEQQAKLERAVQSAEGRLQKASARLVESQQHTPDKNDKFAAQVKQAEVRLTDAKKKLNDFLTSTNFSTNTSGTSSTQTQEAQNEADKDKERLRLEKAINSAMNSIEKTQARLAEADDEKREKFEKQLNAAQERLQKAETKLAEFMNQLETTAAQEKLQTLQPATVDAQPEPDTPMDAASAAIARAQAKASARASMSEEEKLKEQIDGLTKRLSKAEEKLAAAIEEGSDKQEALSLGVEKLKIKLQQAQQQLEDA